MQRLYRQIDSLSEAGSDSPQFVASLQEILRTMAFYISQSEGVLLESREKWRDEGTSKLVRDSRKESSAASASPLSREDFETEKKAFKARRRAVTRHETSRQTAVDEGLPPSLQKLLTGTKSKD